MNAGELTSVIGAAWLVGAVAVGLAASYANGRWALDLSPEGCTVLAMLWPLVALAAVIVFPISAAHDLGKAHRKPGHD